MKNPKNQQPTQNQAHHWSSNESGYRIHNVVLQNVVAILAERLVKGNIHVEDHAKTIRRLQTTPQKE
jgi:uncharacterized membrane protein